MSDAIPTDRPSNTDAEVIRSEERVSVGTRRVPAGRAVLRRTVVVEQRTITVEVRREEVSLEVVPDDAIGDDELQRSRGAHVALPEMVLHAEEVVVTKRVVPVERVRMRIDAVADERRVPVEVRHEEVEATGDITPA